MFLGMLLMEFMVHGWDFVIVIGEFIMYFDNEVEVVLVIGCMMLKLEYCGVFFGFEVEVLVDVIVVECLVVFFGCDFCWQLV